MRVQKLLIGVGILFATTCPALARDLVIHAGTLIDGVSSTPHQRVSILIKDERITAVTPGSLRQRGLR